MWWCGLTGCDVFLTIVVSGTGKAVFEDPVMSVQDEAVEHGLRNVQRFGRARTVRIGRRTRVCVEIGHVQLREGHLLLRLAAAAAVDVSVIRY